MPLTQDDIDELNVFSEIIRRKDGKVKEKQKKIFLDDLKSKNKNFEAEYGITLDKWVKQNMGDFISNYKKADDVMGLGTRISPGDEIYIDCKPTNTFGDVIEPDENIIDTPDITNQVINELAENVHGNNVFNNIGFQAMVGILLLGIIYFIGDYVFIKYPKNFLDNRS